VKVTGTEYKVEDANNVYFFGSHDHLVKATEGGLVVWAYLVFNKHTKRVTKSRPGHAEVMNAAIELAEQYA